MSLPAGHILQNRYRVISLLGQGGMGAVYRVHDSRLNVAVALKEMVPQPGLDQHTLEQLRLQFRQEATILAQLIHANLVNVSDFFEEGGNAYLVMTLVEGSSLSARIKQHGSLPEGEVLHYANQLLAALTYCHRRGVLHRDIKPQNIIIRPDGQAVLVDFGLVKLWDPSDPRTQTAMQGMGTPQYAAPEQYGADPGSHTDPRSDVYSVGATLYHALTARVPPTVTERMADPHRFVVPRRLKPELRPQTEAVILRAMELPRDRRFRSTEEMSAALQGKITLPTQQDLATQQARARAEAQPQETRKTGVPGWMWALGGLAGVVMLVIVVVVVVAVGNQLVPASTPPPIVSSASAAAPTAKPTDGSAAPVIPTVAPGIIYVEYIVDGSSGMAAPLGSEAGTKLLVAQQALVQHWQALGPSANIGLRAYGHRNNATDANTCQDMELLAHVQAGRLEFLVSKLQTVQAKGRDSLAEALRETAADFEYVAERVNAVVLLTDGGDTCGGAPLSVVEVQRETGLYLPVYVVGLGVDAGQKDELGAIADASDGLYYDASSVAELEQALSDIGWLLTQREEGLSK